MRRCKKIELKKVVDNALILCPQEIAEGIKFIITNPIEGREASLTSTRDISLAEFEEKGKGKDEGYIPLEANEPLFIMCTSGTTAQPTQVVHVHGGFQIWTY